MPAFGTKLSEKDTKAIRDMVKHVVAKSIFPHMESQIQTLCKETENQRRAITGRLFSVGRKYFGNNNRGSAHKTGADGEIYYPYTSVEAKLRKLADYSFMLRDFRFAQTVYQAARRDYESDKAWKCFAGAQEMIGICKLLTEVPLPDSKSDFDSPFNDAVTHYLNKTNRPATQVAIRTTLFYTSLLQSARLFSFLPKAFLRVVSPQLRIVTALFLEQAAFAFLAHHRGPKVRRCVFDLVIAAQYFSRANETSGAYRCYRLALEFLEVSTQMLSKTVTTTTTAAAAALVEDNAKDTSEKNMLQEPYTVTITTMACHCVISQPLVGSNDPQIG